MRGFWASFASVSARSAVRVGDERARQLLVEQREEQVLGVELGVAEAARALLRGGDRLLGLDRQLVEVHHVPPFRERRDPGCR